MPPISNRARGLLMSLALLGFPLAQPAAAFAQALASRDLAGACYDLTVGAWRPRHLGADSIFIAPPSRVRFDAAPYQQSRDHFVLLTAPGALTSVHRYALWRPVGSDSVELMWSTGYSGLRMTLGGPATELRGEAQAFWDFPTSPVTADATARRVPCDAPSRVAAQRLVFRAVPLEGGDSVAIGATLSSIRARADSVRGRSFRMRRAPAGPFAGATAVDVAVNMRDTIWRVEISYPDTTELDALIARFSSLLGTPVSRDTFPPQPSNEVANVGASWMNRTTWLTLRRWTTTGGERRVTAVLIDHRVRP